jgi:hypothetical protein
MRSSSRICAADSNSNSAVQAAVSIVMIETAAIYIYSMRMNFGLDG